MQKTTMLKNNQEKKWYEIDASGLILGKLAVEAANILRGKNKPTFTPNIDCGDYLIVRNASKIVLSGNKKDKENWYTHSQYIGGLRTRSGREMLEKYSDELVLTAVKGMLPKNRLSRQLLTKLKVFADNGPDFAAQKPIKYNIK